VTADRDGASPDPDPDPSIDPIIAARRRVGRAIRDLGHAVVGHVAGADELDALADRLAAWAARLEEGPARSRVVERPSGDWGPGPADGEEMVSFEDRPVSGKASPLGLDARVVRDGDDAVCTVTLRAAHEGAPGRSHGGIVAALFDDVYGFLLAIHETPGFTGELTVRYQAGVPLHRPLECRVRLDGRDGRKLHMAGELSGTGDDGHRVVYATSRATFITFDPEVWAGLARAT
jgi:acyl-coenzyme A thioesterase PaaI-like protein